MPKSLAERATELGVDQRELVHTLRILSRWHLKNKPPKRRNRWSYYYERIPIMSLDRAAAFLDLDPEEADREVKKLDPVNWSHSMVLSALFAFYRKNGRWPKTKEFTRANELPARHTYRWIAGAGQSWRKQVSARDWWERQIAADKRCTPKMALTLRNVLARKEAIDRIGFETFIKNGMAEIIDEHPEYGVLYRLPGETPKEPMVLLKVVNSTPEPDGTFADYYLRVPPNQTDVREALRWTFNSNEALGSQPYAPLVET